MDIIFLILVFIGAGVAIDWISKALAYPFIALYRYRRGKQETESECRTSNEEKK